MKTVGIVVEYNPLHNGHLYHFQQSKIKSGADAVVAVMSGHFLQRGEPAIVDKWARAEMALAMGVDMVIELPTAYAVQPAEWFAFGAVSLLTATGVVDALCFGSEHGELSLLQQLAQLLHREPAGLGDAVRAELRRGASYPAAFAAAAGQYAAQAASLGGDADALAAIIKQPNNSLGLHYLIALLRLQSDIVPLTVARHVAGYHEQRITDAQIASATALRRLLTESNGDLAPLAPFVPSTTLQILQREWQAGRGPITWEDYAAPLFHTLLQQDAAALAAYHEVTEGLEQRILHSLPSLPALTVEALLDALKTKRYTRTKLQRMLTHLLLNHAKSELAPDKLQHGVSYIRVLGFSSRGQALLKEMKKKAKLPVITNVPDAAVSEHPFLGYDLRATAIYASAYHNQANPARALFRDYYEPPIRKS